MLEKLAKQTAIYGISTILGRMLGYLLTPFYTRIFGTESYGIITDIYALIPFALVTLTLGMESGYFRFAAKAEAAGGNVAEAKRRLFTTMWGITSLVAAIFFALVAIFRLPISEAMGSDYVAHPEFVVIVAAIVASGAAAIVASGAAAVVATVISAVVVVHGLSAFVAKTILVCIDVFGALTVARVNGFFTYVADTVAVFIHVLVAGGGSTR